MPITYYALPEINVAGEFPAKNLLPETLAKCPALNQSTAGQLTNMHILVYRICMLEKEHDQLRALITGNAVEPYVNHEHTELTETGKEVTSPEKSLIPSPPGLVSPTYLDTIPEEEDTIRSPSPISSSSSDHLLPMMPESIKIPDSPGHPRLNMDDRIYVTLRNSIPSKYRVR